MGDKFENAGLGAGSVLGAAVAGAVVGASLTAAKNIKKVKNGEKTREEVLGEFLKEAGTCGLATAAGALAVRLVGLGSVVGLIGFIPVTIGAKYLMDKALEKKTVTVDAGEASAEATINAEEATS